MPTLPADYEQRVYAGVLGKTIGVYLGRPFESWFRADIQRRLGDIRYYVHDRLNQPLIVADDDLSGTFTFLRALEDFPDAGESITSEQVGNTWLNYIVEGKTILWWGGLGLSSEHTAFLRLQRGIAAPRSGSMELNGRAVSEQIGAQIFIDGWAMVAPGNPELAVKLATQAARVSHDGVAVHAARVIAAMESMAFVETDRFELLRRALRLIPTDSVIARMAGELLDQHARDPHDWERAMSDVLEARYGYDRFGGNCHVVPNHGVVLLALLFGNDDFQRTLMIANTAGWDTDCNSGNIGCLMGIKNGLAGIDAGPDWRGPVADRLLIPTADGGGCVTDCATVALRIANLGRRLAGASPVTPKQGCRYHFSLPGSVQGFVVDDTEPEARGTATVSHRDGTLAIQYRGLAEGRVARVAVATLPTPEQYGAPGYAIIGSPTLYPTQNVVASLRADASNRDVVSVSLYVRTFAPDDSPKKLVSPMVTLRPGESVPIRWQVPETEGQPVASLGIEIAGPQGAAGVVLVESVHWDGTPTQTYRKTGPGSMWLKQWTAGVSSLSSARHEPVMRTTQNHGIGLATIGTQDWRDYRVDASLVPYLASSFGVAARVRGLRRYVALLLTRDAEHRGIAQLVERCDQATVLAESRFEWNTDETSYRLSLLVRGNELVGSIDGKLELRGKIGTACLVRGAVGLLIEEGRVNCSTFRVEPA